MIFPIGYIYLSMYWVNFALGFTVGLYQNWSNNLKWSSHCRIFILVGLSHTKKTGSCAVPSIKKYRVRQRHQSDTAKFETPLVFIAVSLSEFWKSQNNQCQCSRCLCKHLQKYWLCTTEQYSGLAINPRHRLSPKYAALPDLKKQR